MDQENNLQADNHLVRCDVTGMMVPADEVVVFQGQTVSAEGKAVLLDRLKSGEALPGQSEKPTFLQRFGAFMLDNVIAWFVLFVLAFAIGIIVAVTGYDFSGMESEKGVMLFQGGAQLLWVTIIIAYYTIMHGSTGWTLGKKAVQLRVVTLDGSGISYKTAFLRSIFVLGPQILVPFAFLLIPHIAAAVIIGLLYWPYLITNIVLTFSDTTHQRSLHDRIAGTKVIHRP